MPRIVDREARRLEIVETYLAIVAADGIESATTRRLAAELGVATGALWHYFTDFDQVLQMALRLAFERTNERIAAQTAGQQGLDALRVMIEQIHPLDKVTGDEALVVVRFWGRAASHPALGRLQAGIEAEWGAAFRRHLQEAVGAGDLRDGIPVEDIADVLLTLGTGIQVEFALRSEVAEPARQWRIVRTVLGPWLTPSGGSRLPAD